MKNFSTIIFLILHFTIFSSCAEVNVDAESSLDITIPFASAKPFILEDFVSEQSFVLLSTDKEGLYSRADKLIAKHGNFYLFDHLGNSGVLVFDSDGEFVMKIGEFGEGPTQLRSITDFQVAENGDVLILDQPLQTITTYSSEGSWKNKIKLSFDAGAFTQSEDKWFFALNRFNQNEELLEDYKLGIFDSNIQLDSLYFHYSTDSENANVYYHPGILSVGEYHLTYHRTAR